jgi:hypothetical protein
MFTELENHCKLLDNVLRPHYQGAETQLKRPERRIVGRLLPEVIELVQQLKQERSELDQRRS